MTSSEALSAVLLLHNLGMFEIGTSLKESRTRQGLELEQIATATMIRVRYLEAL